MRGNAWEDPDDENTTEDEETLRQPQVEGVACCCCGEEICTVTAFCGYCGFKNRLFDEGAFFTAFDMTLAQEREELCTDFHHEIMVLTWTGRTIQAKRARERLEAAGIKPHKLHYCPRCGLELITNASTTARDIQLLIDSAFA